MSTRQDGAQPSPTVQSKDDLVQWIAAGSKPKSAWRIGTEHEKFVFYTKTLEPVPYEGPRGIRALMQAMIDRYGWEPIMEGKNIIGLKRPKGEGAETVSLEPGGQFELSGAPLETLHETCAETGEHLSQATAIGKDLGLGFLGVGFSPKWTIEETPRMPKQRYAVMTRYMPQVGKHGLDMMYRTCTIQVNLDFGDEADMVKKFRVSLALQPIATALFAASPFKEGKPTGFKSLRSEVWRDTDPDRTGMLPFVFEPGMGFERYTDYALDVPMYFVYRNGRYIDVAGASFRDFMEGRLPQLPGERPTLEDWSDHLTTLFPEVRMKRFLEMRGADGGRWRRICALPAFWVGLLYDQTALDAAWDLVKDWTAEERQSLRDSVPKWALDAPFRKGTVKDIAREAVAIARTGLKNRNKLNANGDDECIHLHFVEDTAASGRTPADDLLSRYEGHWQGDINHIFTDYAF
ncbi:MAG: glutamate--cysteine ligase [Proteobacteria bacterium]|jgi:glutamate--cysteine ligase, plant type|nr:MAG: glutamate--cysteine ligase [Pseudomonadota bacterium]